MSLRAAAPAVARNGGPSFWYAATQVPGRRPPLPGDRDADVCIVGGGLSGLWTAYYLKRAQPDLRIVVLEREFAGFGASGRNGGWLSSEFVAPRRAVAARVGHDAVVRLQRAMQTTVDEVIARLDEEGVDADVRKDGVLHVGRNGPQLDRLRAHLAEDRAFGLTEDDVRELDADALAERVRIARAVGGTWNRHCARVQPAKLVRGVAAAVERLGVDLYEGTTVEEIVPGAARTDRGTVRATYVLRCLEGFTPSLRGERRTWLPMNSAIVATAPLAPETWERIGWRGAEVFGDHAHAYMYAQRTADGRIALGGRGVPYRFGSRTDRDGRTQPATIAGLVELLHDMFPAVAETPVDHAWCGVLGVPRDWSPSVHVDHETGLGWAGGYVGSGLSTTNLAGRTLRDLVLRRESDLTTLPWVRGRVRRWEPEPLRWLGVRAIYGLYRTADRREAAGLGRTSRLARLADRV
ncbi:NAD(P)/FAD-dependent oxidoreductase, partial [Patulibacter sp. S7RM1-6]